jgi:FHA domain
MRQFLTLASILGVAPTPIYKSPFVIAGAVLVIALIILVVALFLFRNSGKKKNAANPPGGNDWQRQPGAGQPGQQGWGQQGGWDAGAAQQQQAGGWGMPAPQQPQQPAWGSPAQQQQAGGWGMPGQAQQPQPQQPAWGTPAASQPQQGGWDAPAQQQQAGGWGTPAQPQQPQQQQSSGWGTPAQPQQPPAGWGTPAQPQQGGWGGQQGAAGGGASSWDQTALPSSQDAWGQQPAPGAAPAWGGQNNQQQAPAAFSNNAVGQPWGQPAQAADPWGQAAQQQAQPGAQAQAAWPGNSAQPSTTPPGGNPPVPAWQQQAPGFGQAQQGFGSSPFENADADRTILRPTGGNPSPSQTGLGYVRIEEGKEPGKSYEVRKESLSIGRSRESDIFLEDLAVSRLHASIINMGGGNYALRDEGSANGTKVNGQTVNKYQPYPLQEGDKIQLGQTVLVFARR